MKPPTRPSRSFWTFRVREVGVRPCTNCGRPSCPHWTGWSDDGDGGGPRDRLVISAAGRAAVLYALERDPTLLQTIPPGEMAPLLGYSGRETCDHNSALRLAASIVGPAAAPVEIRRQEEMAADLSRFLWRSIVQIADALTHFESLSGREVRALLAWEAPPPK
jgi:hypothetical protein